MFYEYTCALKRIPQNAARYIHSTFTYSKTCPATHLALGREDFGSTSQVETHQGPGKCSPGYNTSNACQSIGPWKGLEQSPDIGNKTNALWCDLLGAWKDSMES